MKLTIPKFKKHQKKYSIRQKDREYFTDGLAILLKAGVPLGDAMESFKNTSRSRSLKKAVSAMQEKINDGESLKKVLEGSNIVSKQTLALIDLGEKSGNLVQNLTVAAAQEEKQRIFRGKIHSALIYPAFVLSLTAVVGTGVAWFLLPKLAVTFTQLGTDLPFISKVFINLGVLLKNHGLIIVPLAITLAFVLNYIIFFAPISRKIGQIILLHTPGISKLIKSVEIARFGYLLGTLLKSGLSITDSLHLLGQATNLISYQRLYYHLEESFRNGDNFQKAFASYHKSDKLIPPTVQQIVIAGERSGSLPETLETISNAYEAKSDVATQNLSTILEPFLLVIVWLGVLGVAIAVILPIYKLVGGLGS